ncbi:Predicted amidohydrolase [Halorhodospira halochloris]|uniref:Predicted amidohydrolase n=1 Tax=Halorhodospira halochloris TaxID=1052 RepID=A0A110B2E0_HALHR|nr:carbon-nitrogen hydrolase family protein [Halorhodospira halochloris]MCG5548107.1 carbon-nitrogen hydrolase family protein [Halorhodospira halochloris]BAU58555.1 Predicted amidohydrolase [Halorhodospira halochloris]
MTSRQRFSVAAVQMASGPHVDANLQEAGRLISKACRAGASLVALPENFAFMGYTESDKLKVAEPDGVGVIQDFLSAQASSHGIFLVGGTVPLSTASGTKIRPAVPVYGPDGKRWGCYDKIHLFDVEVAPGEAYRESEVQQGGHEPLLLDTPLGKIGLGVCYDLRFPELFRELAKQGMELLVLPSAFTAVTGEAHWNILVRTRAVENLCYVVAPDQGGYHVNGRETHGESMVVDPWGGVIDSLPSGSGIALGEVDLQRLHEIRSRFPALGHRKL